MSRPDIEAMEGRARKATDGPWTCREGIVRQAEVQPLPSGVILPPARIAVVDSRTAEDPENGEFIAHSRQDIPDLIAYVRELEASLALADEFASRFGETQLQVGPEWVKCFDAYLRYTNAREAK